MLYHVQLCSRRRRGGLTYRRTTRQCRRVFSRIPTLELVATTPGAALLRRVDHTAAGRGAWRVIACPKRRSYVVEHRPNRSRLIVYYGTRTERSCEDAEEQATALCAAVNALKVKRI